MTKKVLIVTICLVTVCAVLGLNDRLNYEGLQTATSMVRADSNEVAEDLQVVSVIATAIEHFAPQKIVSITVEEQTTTEGETVYILIYVSYYGNPVVTGDLDLTTEHWVFTDRNTAEQIRFVLEPLTRSTIAPSGDNFFSEVLTGIHYIGFWVSLLVSVVMALLIVICDTVAVVWSLVEASFYLLGF